MNKLSIASVLRVYCSSSLPSSNGVYLYCFLLSQTLAPSWPVVCCHSFPWSCCMLLLSQTLAPSSTFVYHLYRFYIFIIVLVSQSSCFFLFISSVDDEPPLSLLLPPLLRIELILSLLVCRLIDQVVLLRTFPYDTSYGDRSVPKK
ncbi:hypothetical protein PGT21_030597 [Puccinia graminis f. sp. tritici]|uniref:Uncharacterized protein n=1 Tax=Puccinia graminis f. sp. tritici TaxID=56615 RepID=A0A5B0NP00_PUCGR|nr:hypothetical protein PGTUg99_050241 [Puccinia graminis f. sp. tritici]KAA1113394.1 hypothetical protein PGT21_030597 [Puccinia graminis f. sp. tritici]KAA1137824.1 hypothetical protein PGTUg99_050276 [Puccinia graminis f. sp. tritici]